MQVIRVRNVHEALPEAVDLILRAGRPEETRNGPALVYPEPVTTVYERPRERVIFWPPRDANPFFHLYEALWMIGGRNDVESIARFVGRMRTFSDDGETFHGAYGYRWRKFFGFDQLEQIAANFTNDPGTRRQVLQIWDGPSDLFQQERKRDIPCNLVVHFQLGLGSLDMTVFCRSNDIVWGCYGANAVHFSVLQEVLAARIGVPVGRYWHVSDNWHAYVDTLEPISVLANYRAQPAFAGNRPPNPYDGWVTPFPIISAGYDGWCRDLEMFLSTGLGAMGYTDPFFRHVALPMLRAHDIWKTSPAPAKFEQAIAACGSIKATDWQMACEQWLERRWMAWKTRTL